MQSPHVQYANPPVREAVCEFRFQAGPEPWDLSLPGLIYNELRADFPRRIQGTNPQQVFSITFGNAPEQMLGLNPADPAQSLRFWRQDSHDGVITVAPNRMSISHYRPYPSWDKFISIVRQAYSSYLNVAQPQAIQRIGLRYINEIQFNAPAVRLDDYFTYYPNFGPALPSSNWNVKMSVDFAYNDHRDLARLQLATVTGPDGSAVAVSLDIDYFLVIPGAVALTDTEEWLDQGHTVVHSIFEGSITDRTRAMFDGEEEQ